MIERQINSIETQKDMKTNLLSSDFPVEIEGFIGGMGFKSVASITESDLGFDYELDVKGYISEPIDDVYYAEVRDWETDRKSVV